MTQRCVWCHGSAGSVREAAVTIVDRLGGNPSEQSVWIHAEHEDVFRRFVESVNQHARKVVLGIVAWFGVVLVVPITASLLGGPERLVSAVVGSSVACLGAMFFRFPFATPETTALMGVKRSITIVRVLAGGMIAYGLAIMLSVR